MTVFWKLIRELVEAWTLVIHLQEESFQEEYGRLPSLYASQGYDTANLILSAMGKAAVGDADAFRGAIAHLTFTARRSAGAAVEAIGIGIDAYTVAFNIAGRTRGDTGAANKELISKTIH